MDTTKSKFLAKLLIFVFFSSYSHTISASSTMGVNAGAKMALKNVRPYAELNYIENDLIYTNVCESDEVSMFINAAVSNIVETEIRGDNGYGTSSRDMSLIARNSIDSKKRSPTCHDSKDAYAAAIPLIPLSKIDVFNFWCMDSSGYAGYGFVPAFKTECVQAKKFKQHWLFKHPVYLE